ncbi:MAG: sigma-70 family RNA polymerase sigma factor [Balneolaceae bacterium]|nr:MAG: sigma-70 family RNA polymerase sigma factor [Balneolaceae bacterium]
MPSSSGQDHLTKLLNSVGRPDSESVNELLPMVYDELRQIAHRELRNERSGHTLNTTALVHEAYLKLIQNPPKGDWEGRKHFFMIAARAMRQVLVNYARSRNSQKRGSGDEPIALEDGYYLSQEKANELIDLDDALSRLEKLDERLSSVVECRYFGGYGIDETADILGISPATVKRDWTSARAWLFSQIKK